jgi:drug/metabolite transporter (DMT)-like permease
MLFPLNSRPWIGITLALAAAVAFALSSVSASLAVHGGSNALTLAATRFVLPIFVLVAWLRMQGVPLRLTSEDSWLAMVLGAVTAAYSWAFLSSIGTIPVALAVLIFHLFPLVAAVILAICGWEKLGWQAVAAIVLSFFGLTLALDPRAGNFDIGGVTLAFGSALGFGTVIAVSSRIFRGGDSRSVTLYIAAVSAVLLMLLCAAQGNFAFPTTDLGWAGFVGAAALYAFALIAFFIAVSAIGPVRSSLLSYAEPVAAAGFGIVLLGEALSLTQLAGIAIVTVSLVGATLWRPRIN